MSSGLLEIHAQPRLGDGRLVLGFSGWMDGGSVSTGTVDWLVSSLEAERAAEIRPAGFYIYNFPGSMEVAAAFRPHTRITGGLIAAYEPPTNVFYCDRATKLLLFSGKEPNLDWEGFADCFYSFASEAGVRTLYFIGSVAGAVPHTREPRLLASVSDAALKALLEPFVVRFTDYEGPASFTTYLMTLAPRWGMRMFSLVAEIPPYIQGTNPKCIEAMVRKLAVILGLRVPIERLREVSDAWEKRLNEVLENEPELAKHIQKLEADYDNEVFDTQMADLKQWLQDRGVRLD